MPRTASYLLNVFKNLYILLFFLVSTVAFSQGYTPLTTEEINQIQNDLGVTLTQTEKDQIAQITKPSGTPQQWRVDAEARIEQHRKGDLTIEVIYDNNTPVTGAQVNIELKKSTFNFGGVVRAQDLIDADGKLSSAGSSTQIWKNLVTKLFNAVGAGNNFKPKLASNHLYLPDFMTWTASEDLSVRGHLLMWPGKGGIEDMDAPGSVSGVDYGNHLSRGYNEPLQAIPGYESIVSYDVLGAVETYKASARTPQDKAALKAEVDAEIQQWSSLWNVYEWDVINETISNRLLQDILGYDQMAAWFDIAEANVVNPECKLLINEFKIISASPDVNAPQWLNYSYRKDQYMSRINQIIADGGRVDRIGFQNRYNNAGVASPETTYNRLDEWATTYNREMVGTEFEVVDDSQDFTELERAQITDQTLLTYYSHPLTTGLFNWTFMHETDEKALTYYDGTVKLNGLVWYYLHRIKFNTKEQLTTNAQGLVNLSGFKGKYDVIVTVGGVDYVNDMTSNLLLNDANSYQLILNTTNNTYQIVETTLSINEHELNDIEITLHPNPVNDYLHIKTDNKINSIQIFDVSGKLISKKEAINTINLIHLSKGLYIVKIDVGSKLFTKKIVID